MTREEYNKKIKPTMEKITLLAMKEEVPFFAAFAVTEKDGSISYETSCLTPGVIGKPLEDDRITKMINVINGFDTIPPHQTIEIEFK